jgi:hypothetical protein
MEMTSCAYEDQFAPDPTNPKPDIAKALNRAFMLGQRYWQQADSEYTSYHKKADVTRSEFNALVAETVALAAPVAAVPEAFHAIKTAMSDDEGYAWGWHCNLAMAFIDTGASHRYGNEAAAVFMERCFGINVKKFSAWATTFPEVKP